MKVTSTQTRLLDAIIVSPPDVSNAELASHVHRSVRVVQRGLSELARSGLILIEHRRPATAGDVARMIVLNRDRFEEVPA